MPELRYLTEEGLVEASALLAMIRSGELSSLPEGFLTDDRLTAPEGRRFTSFSSREVRIRWELAVWLYRVFGDREPISTACWSWLALCLLEHLCPIRNGTRKVWEDARYLLQADDYRKAHRHLLAGPYLLFSAHSDNPGAIKGLLTTELDTLGEVYEQLASKKYLITSRAVVSTATALYLDPTTGTLRRGAGGSGAGSPRRLSDVLQQFDKTYDLLAMSPKTLDSLLPAEFDRFRRA